MCFYYDDDPAEVWQQRIAVARKEYKCISCNRAIISGEQRMHIFYVHDGEPGQINVCNQCAQDAAAIHRHEKRAGCTGAESWCPWENIADTMRHGNSEERCEEFDGDDERGYGPVLFWPYDVAPAAQAVDLKQIPELLRL